MMLELVWEVVENSEPVMRGFCENSLGFTKVTVLNIVGYPSLMLILLFVFQKKKLCMARRVVDWLT